jgi:uncharacterized coiled-coil protein SlyX
MYSPIPLATMILVLSNVISRSVSRCGLLLISVSWLALSSETRAVTPAPDGDYGNGNTAEGRDALFSLTTGTLNTAIGTEALFGNTTGSANTANGNFALSNNTTASNNTATGFEALLSNTTGLANTATGSQALLSNTSGDSNTATGVSALFSNTTGFNNTASGFEGLSHNTTGFNNTASGANALFSNTSGFNNAANGFTALQNNTTGNSNTAEGDGALSGNTTGSSNTACGINALLNNTIGKSNVALGNNAGANLTTGSNNIDIGAVGVAGEANAIRVGKQGTQKQTFIAGIFGVAVSGSTVVVNSSGKLGVAVSSARFKEAIKPMDKVSEAILALTPVTFRYKEDIDPERIPQFGLVAEEVEKVNPDLVVRDENGKVNTVRYDAVNAMLLNEFLKEHRTVEQQQSTITELKSAMAEQKATNAQQQKQIEALTSTVQRVRDQVAFSKSAPQLVANP